MRIMIGKRKDGLADVMVVPSRREHLPPVVRRGIPRGEMKAAAEALLAGLEQAKQANQEPRD